MENFDSANVNPQLARLTALVYGDSICHNSDLNKTFGRSVLYGFGLLHKPYPKKLQFILCTPSYLLEILANFGNEKEITICL